MLVEGPVEFWEWAARTSSAAAAGDRRARARHDLVLALLLELYELPSPPDRDLGRVPFLPAPHHRQHPVWRLGGRVGIAEVRFLCAFPVGTGVALVVSPHGDAVRLGDLFPRAVTARADACVEGWLRARATQATVPPRSPRGFGSGDEQLAHGLARVGAGARVAAVRRALHDAAAQGVATPPGRWQRVEP